jgi:hypothetical protein
VQLTDGFITLNTQPMSSTAITTKGLKWSTRINLLCMIAMTMPNAAHAEIVELESSYRFLISDQSQGGVLHTANTGVLKGYALPVSFVDSAEYWGAYVCRQNGNSCTVRDIYNPADYSLTPMPGAAAELQVERVNVHNGANIYDAATWQIAVMLGRVVNRFTLPDKQDAYALANNQTRWLHDSAETRAVTRATVFVYNGETIAEPQRAYAFRMLSRTWLATDPFMNTRYAALISTDRLPNNAEYQSGKVSWTDWKPITGENAWAFLIGPLQAAYLHYVRAEQQPFVPFRELAIQNALAVLPTFAVLQAPLGAVYYAPAGTIRSRGTQPVNPHEVSVENNFSLYAGLTILQATLRAELAHESDLTAADKRSIAAALATIHSMINGGSAVSGRSTAGLLSFFKNHAWNQGEFVQGGYANDPQQHVAWIPTLQPKAVDVNTWGIAALGAAQVDDWFGFGASYKTWQQVKAWGAYGKDTELWGVGYSDQDGNGRNRDGTYKQGILSAEWTAGAINMVRAMLRYYGDIASGATNYALSQDYVAALKQDERTMLVAVQSLRADQYQRTQFPGTPDSYASLIKSNANSSVAPYLYASKRYAIPFGWYANPLPSTCATAWMLMLADNFDPLMYSGLSAGLSSGQPIEHP